MAKSSPDRKRDQSRDQSPDQSRDQSPDQSHLRLPQVDKLLRHPEIVAREKEIRRDCMANLTRQVLDEYRQSAKSQTASRSSHSQIDESEIVAAVLARADSLLQGSLQRVINGTGVILNTNLGRAPLPAPLVEKLSQLLPGYSSLEIDLKSGVRGERAAAIERLLVVLTGCEAAIVVNNNAAAVLLLVNALANSREVIVSRGELIEIGGSFRLPDVIVAGGAILKEVGTTNKTRADDYARAINDNTALILKCHRSNFEISGFTEEPDRNDLMLLAREKNIPLVEDLGSGALLDLSHLNLKHEPTVQEALKFSDVVMFSGDKLLGGSQAGLIVGKRDLIIRLRSHPIYRALRLDKLNIALLESTLAEYLRPDAAEIMPVYHMAGLSKELLQERAFALVERLNARLKRLRCESVETESAFGGGTMPNQAIKSCGLKISDTEGGARGALSANRLAELMRKNRPAIVTLTSGDAVIIDLRTVSVSEELELEVALVAIDNRFV